MALRSFPALRPKTDRYLNVYTNASELLICIFGNLVCGTSSIPIDVRIPLAYPGAAVEFYIRPSPGSKIRPTPMVDAYGMVSHPCIRQGSSSLAEVLWSVANGLASDPPFYVGSGRPVYSPNVAAHAGRAPPYDGSRPLPGMIIQPMVPQQTAMPHRGPYGGEPPPTFQTPPPFQTPQRLAAPQTFPAPQAFQAPPSSQVPFAIATARSAGSGSGEDAGAFRRAFRDRLVDNFKRLQRPTAVEADRLVGESSRLTDGAAVLSRELEGIALGVGQVQDAIAKVRSCKEDLLAKEADAARRGALPAAAPAIDYGSLVVAKDAVAKQYERAHPPGHFSSLHAPYGEWWREGRAVC